MTILFFCLFFFISRCTFVPDRQVRLEAVRELFLAAYSSTVGLKSSSPSPSGAISGLLEQFARGVGLRGTNAIIWVFHCCAHKFHSTYTPSGLFMSSFLSPLHLDVAPYLPHQEYLIYWWNCTVYSFIPSSMC